MRVGILTGLQTELDAVRRATPPDLWNRGILVRCSGARRAIARVASAELAGLPVDALLSFGIAGGLTSNLAPGTVVIADRITRLGGEAIGTDRPWRNRLTAAAPDAVVAPIHGGDDALTETMEKRRVHEVHGAVAVDMESHHLALAAQAAGIPFVAIRVVADRAERRIPGYVLGAVDSDGATHAWPVVRGLLKRPADLPTLVSLSLETGKAFAALRRVATRHGPFFGFV